VSCGQVKLGGGRGLFNGTKCFSSPTPLCAVVNPVKKHTIPGRGEGWAWYYSSFGDVDVASRGVDTVFHIYHKTALQILLGSISFLLEHLRCNPKYTGLDTCWDMQIFISPIIFCVVTKSNEEY